MYDIIFLGNTGNEWDALKLKYPNAQRLEKNTAFKDICKRSFTKLFWIVWDDLVLDTTFNLNEYRTTEWDNQYVHVFKNGECFDGICLIPKSSTISQREFDNRFFVNNKKEINITASHPKPFDIIFISYNEENADENYKKLCQRFSHAKRVDGVKGIHQAHIAAAELAATDMFWVVDGDAQVLDTFNFDHQVPSNEAEMVHVWRSINPINNLEYGYGGVKLLPKNLTMNMNVNNVDMTTSISKSFKAMSEVSNITAFNTDAFSTWRSAFRECVKLSSKTIDRHLEEETLQRLDIWCQDGSDKKYSQYAIDGARQGRAFGEKFKGTETLNKINDFDWLLNTFTEKYGSENTNN